MVLVYSISNFFTNKTSLANKWMSFSSSNLALRISQDPSKRSNNYNSIFWEKLDKIYETAAIQGRFSSVACQKINKREKINILVVSLPLTRLTDTDLSKRQRLLPSIVNIEKGTWVSTVWAVWQYKLWSFQTGYTKLERFLH